MVNQAKIVRASTYYIVKTQLVAGWGGRGHPSKTHLLASAAKGLGQDRFELCLCSVLLQGVWKRALPSPQPCQAVGQGKGGQLWSTLAQPGFDPKCAMLRQVTVFLLICNDPPNITL